MMSGFAQPVSFPHHHGMFGVWPLIFYLRYLAEIMSESVLSGILYKNETQKSFTCIPLI